jgi:hypothetical protein
MAKSAKEIRIELRKKKQLQSAPATSSHNGAGTSREVRLRAEPREAGTSNWFETGYLSHGAAQCRS